MKLLLSLTFLTSQLFTPALDAQALDPAALMQRGVIGLDGGFWPDSFSTLVGSSSIIVKGRYGELLSNRMYWGYDENSETGLVSRKSFKERYGFTDEETDLWARPISDYEIIVDVVLLGDIQSSTIIYRTLETSPNNRQFTDPNVDRLFFLRENSDGTFTALDYISILNEKDGIYSYYAFDFTGEVRDEIYDFAPSMRVDEIERKISEEILKFEIAN